MFDPKPRDFHPSPLAQKSVPLDGAYTVRMSQFQRVERHTSRATGWRSDGMVAGCVTPPKTRDFGRPPLAQTPVPLDGTYTIQISAFWQVERHTSRPTGWKSDGMVTGCLTQKHVTFIRHHWRKSSSRWTGRIPFKSADLNESNGIRPVARGGEVMEWWRVV